MFLEALDGSRHETGFNGLNPRKTIELRDTPELQPTEHYFGPDPQLAEVSEHYFGPDPKRFAYVPRKYMNVAPQMRAIFDPEEQDNLATSINAAGLQNPLIMFEMGEELKDWYVNLCNEAWPGEADPSQYIENEDGNYWVLIAGERRLRAIDSTVDSKGYDPEKVFISCQIRTCESSLDMMRSQAAENIYNAPRPFQYATIIHEIYRLGLEAGLYETEAEFIREHSPAGREATKNALRFFKLPSYVRDYVAQDEIGYGHSLILLDYYQAYEEKLDDMDITDDEKDQLMKIRLESRLLKIISAGWTKTQLESFIPGWISELYFEESSLFERDFQDPDRDQFEDERNRIRESNRGLLGSTGAALKQHGKMLDKLAVLDRDMLRQLDPSIRRQLEVAGGFYEVLARTHFGKALGELAAQRAIDVRAILVEDEQLRLD